MAQTFKADILRVSMLMQVTAQSPLVGSGTVNLTAPTKHQFFVRPAAIPSPGTDAASILVVKRSGELVALSTAIQDYLFAFVRPRYRIAGTSNGDINFGTATIDFLPEGSDVATFITAFTPTTTGWVNAVGINVISNQLIVTLRTQSGRITKLVYNNGITNPARPVRPPTTDAGIQAYFNDIVGPNSIIRGRDGAPAIAAVGWFAGQNEKLWRDVAR